MKTAEKKQAIELRKTGMSMNEIADIVKVSKASISLWTRKVELTSDQKNKLSRASRSVGSIEKRRTNRLVNEAAKRNAVMLGAGKDIELISGKELKIIGAMLYWGEGGKTKRMVRVTNSDPSVIKVMMRFFRETCGVKEERFRGYVHTFSHLNAGKSEKYWSGVSGIPVVQFYKTYCKPSRASLNKKDSLPHGTFDVYICDGNLFLKIMGWIEKIKTLLIS